MYSQFWLGTSNMILPIAVAVQWLNSTSRNTNILFTTSTDFRSGYIIIMHLKQKTVHPHWLTHHKPWFVRGTSNDYRGEGGAWSIQTILTRPGLVLKQGTPNQGCSSYFSPWKWPYIEGHFHFQMHPNNIWMLYDVIYIYIGLKSLELVPLLNYLINMPIISHSIPTSDSTMTFRSLTFHLLLVTSAPYPFHLSTIAVS